MNEAVAGYILAREQQRTTVWETDGARSGRRGVVALAATIAAIVGVVALGSASSSAADGPSMRHSYVVGGEVVVPPPVPEPSIADPIAPRG